MVGLVLISHIPELAEGCRKLLRLLAKEAPIELAAGTDDGRAGTSLEKIVAAVQAADQGEGVVLIMDLGSAVMTAEMALEMLTDTPICMLDAPFVEGAVVAATAIERGLDLKAVEALVISQKNVPKF